MALSNKRFNEIMNEMRKCAAEILKNEIVGIIKRETGQRISAKVEINKEKATGFINIMICLDREIPEIETIGEKIEKIYKELGWQVSLILLRPPYLTICFILSPSEPTNPEDRF